MLVWFQALKKVLQINKWCLSIREGVFQHQKKVWVLQKSWRAQFTKFATDEVIIRQNLVLIWWKPGQLKPFKPGWGSSTTLIVCKSSWSLPLSSLPCVLYIIQFICLFKLRRHSIYVINGRSRKIQKEENKVHDCKDQFSIVIQFNFSFFTFCFARPSAK